MDSIIHLSGASQKEQTLSLSANLYMKDWFRLCHRSQRALVLLPGFIILFLVSSFDTASFFVSNFIMFLKADESIHHIKLRQRCPCMYTFWFLPHNIAVMMISAARKKMALKGLLLVLTSLLFFMRVPLSDNRNRNILKPF